MRAKPLNLKSPQGRQITRLLARRSGIKVSIKSQTVLQSAGRTVQVWIMEPAATTVLPASPAPAVVPTSEPAAPAYSWSAGQSDGSAAPTQDSPLVTLSQRAIEFMRGSAPALGLDADEFNGLHAVLGEAILGCSKPGGPTAQPASTELAQLLAWLWSFRRTDSPLTRAVAAALACACFRPQHLWDELGLAGRDPLNTLLSGHFPQLYRLNYTHMGWKKFILLQCKAAAAVDGREGRRLRALP